MEPSENEDIATVSSHRMRTDSSRETRTDEPSATLVPFCETVTSSQPGSQPGGWSAIEGHESKFIDLAKLLLGQKFATGTYGQIFHGVYDGREVAVKILKQPECAAEEDAANGQDMEHQCKQEVDMLGRMDHPNVLRLVGACKNPPCWCIVTEFIAGGDLRGFLNRRDGQALPIADVIGLALEIAKGMAYLHEKGIVHRDLKPDNLLLGGDQKTVVISDFGVSRVEASAVMTAETGTYRWMAPEMIDHQAYTRKVDVYSFAIVLWELCAMELPFNGMTAVQAAFAVVNKAARPPMPKSCPPVLKRLIEDCWANDADKRPTFDTVVTRLEEMSTFLSAHPNDLSVMPLGEAPVVEEEHKQKRGSFFCCFG